jgi:hypothetical protein
MDHLNLVLKFRLAGDNQFQIKGAARIKVDGCGGLTFYDVQSGKTERIEVGELQSLSLLSVSSETEGATSQSGTLRQQDFAYSA